MRRPVLNTGPAPVLRPVSKKSEGVRVRSSQVINGAGDAEASKEGHAGFDPAFGFRHDTGPAAEPGEPMALLGIRPFTRKAYYYYWWRQQPPRRSRQQSATVFPRSTHLLAPFRPAHIAHPGAPTV
jgi:hypothetical protein